jgi:hypothetical protein
MDVPNLRGQTPLDMLKVHQGAGWMTPKLRDRIKELTQRKPGRFRLDKRCRWWSMAATPFLVFYACGLIFDAETFVLIKLSLLVGVYLCGWAAEKFLWDEQLVTILPLSIYMATKFWFYVVWFVYIANVVSPLETVGFVISSLGLWFCFLKSTRDPGVIQTTQEMRFRTIIELSEKGGAGFDPALFCSACLVKRPLRSKHCSSCDRCVAR